MKYSFAGENLQVSVNIYNKLLQPLYIDLTRSTVVLNNSQVSDPFYRDGQISFIAPLASVTLKSNPIKTTFINLHRQDSLKDETMKTNMGLNHIYNEGTTPVFFRTILAITPNENYSYPTFFDYSFWVSDVLQTLTTPRSFIYKPSNQFYIRKTTAFTKVAYGSVIVTGLIGAGLSPAEE
jgi:hypothetical protein